eukprot:SAG11_NODE_2595_length_3185_cov_8.000324_5_plen_107_part_00
MPPLTPDTRRGQPARVQKRPRMFPLRSGTLNGTKYWRVKNSWGRHFGATKHPAPNDRSRSSAAVCSAEAAVARALGETGYFRVRRGTDEIAIESMAMSALPVAPPS